MHGLLAITVPGHQIQVQLIRVGLTNEGEIGDLEVTVFQGAALVPSPEELGARDEVRAGVHATIVLASALLTLSALRIMPSLSKASAMAWRTLRFESGFGFP